jgi:hypothetical protein
LAPTFLSEVDFKIIFSTSFQDLLQADSTGFDKGSHWLKMASSWLKDLEN